MGTRIATATQIDGSTFVAGWKSWHADETQASCEAAAVQCEFNLLVPQSNERHSTWQRYSQRGPTSLSSRHSHNLSHNSGCTGD